MEADLARVITEIHATPTRVVIEFAGAGSQAVTWLHAVGGSSRTVLEATDRYAAASVLDATGFEPAQFASVETAQALATTAYNRAAFLAEPASPVVGLGCAATIATDRTKQGRHRCCLAVRDRRGITTYTLTLKKGERTRVQEEAVVSLLIIQALAEAGGIEAAPPPVLLDVETLVKDFEPVDLLMQAAAGEVDWVKVGPDGSMTSGESLSDIALLSGAFNPLHEGHRQMARVGGHILQKEVYFELPLINADKASLSMEETRRRIAQFSGWATLILSRASLFSQKARLFPDSVFIVGVDTAARLLQARFYHHNPAEMFAALDMIRAAGCRFLTAGRLVDEERFLTLADIDIPAGYQALFDQIPPEDFRVDISSTAIRQNLT